MRVVAIFTGPEERGPIAEVPEIEVIAGAGIVGDRYYQGDLPEDERDPELEITLFAREPLERVNDELGIGIEPVDLRRNLLTEGVDLLSLVGNRFRVGEVEIEALADNPPCRYLQEMVGKPVLKPLIRDGGIRGRIVTSGTIRVGDPISITRS